MLSEAAFPSRTIEEFLTTGPTSRSDTTWIYFVNIDNGRAIKIGHSRQARGKRLKQHAATRFGITVNVEPICEVQGTIDDETTVHRYFKAALLPGEKEVFEPAEELIDYIRWLRDQWFVVTPEITDEQRDAMPVVESDTWLPRQERRKPRPSEILPGFHGAFDFGDREITIDDFYTPEVIIEAARSTMGCIDTDPASHAVANRVVRAKTFWTKSDNGLTKPWFGKVWVNPPFSTWSEWSAKAIAELSSGRVDEMCVLAATRTLTAQYFAPLIARCDAMCIFRGRLKFWGEKARDPDDGHAVMYYGNNRDTFRKMFSELGTVLYGRSGQ